MEDPRNTSNEASSDGYPALYRRLFEAADLGILIYHWDAPPVAGSFRLIAQNAAAVRAGSGPDAVGKTLDEGDAALLASPIPARYAMVLATGQPLTWSIEWPALDGTVFYAVSCFALSAEHIAVFFQDESDKRVAQVDLARKLVELERSNRDLDDFAYVASHDLKSPLRDIHNLASWIEEDLGSSLAEATARHVRVLRERILRMERLLDDLLAYSRAGRAAPTPELVPLEAAVTEAVGFLQPKRHEVVVDASVAEVNATPVGFALVLRNLIANAIKHHDRGSGRIVVEARPAEGGVDVVVRDDGPGIAPEYHERVFRLFQTLRPRDEVDASGMGLAIVKRVVESHSGSVTIESEGRGTAIRTFWPATAKDPR